MDGVWSRILEGNMIKLEELYGYSSNGNYKSKLSVRFLRVSTTHLMGP